MMPSPSAPELPPPPSPDLVLPPPAFTPPPLHSSPPPPPAPIGLPPPSHTALPRLRKTVTFPPDMASPRLPPTEALPTERSAMTTSNGARSIRSYNSFAPSHGSDSESDDCDRDPTPPPPPPPPVNNHNLGEYTGLFGKLGAIELENKGSVARDHLALERTFLAWLRTSLAFASIGIAITQLFRLNSGTTQDAGVVGVDAAPETLKNIGKPLGATFLGIAILVLLVGVNRYFESQAWLLQGKFPASRGSVFLITSVAFALIVSSLVIVVIVSGHTEV